MDEGAGIRRHVGIGVEEPVGCFAQRTRSTVRFWLRIQPIDATHWPKRSAGVSKLSVSLGRSFSRRATALSLILIDARQVHPFREVLPQ